MALITNGLDIIVADAEGTIFYTVLHPIFLISPQFWSWSMPWATPESSIRRRSRKVRIVLISYLSHTCALVLNQRLNRLMPRFSPPEIVHSPDKLASLLGGDEPPIHLGRPGGAPAALFNHALAILQRSLEHLEEVEVSRLDVERAAKYLQCVVKFYKDEAQYQMAITELINEAIGENGEWGRTLGWADSIRPDSCWWYYEFLILVLDLKNTLGLAGDALLQAIIDYSKIIPQERV